MAQSEGGGSYEVLVEGGTGPAEEAYEAPVASVSRSVIQPKISRISETNRDFLIGYIEDGRFIKEGSYADDELPARLARHFQEDRQPYVWRPGWPDWELVLRPPQAVPSSALSTPKDAPAAPASPSAPARDSAPDAADATEPEKKPEEKVWWWMYQTDKGFWDRQPGPLTESQVRAETGSFLSKYRTIPVKVWKVGWTEWRQLPRPEPS